MLEIIKFILRFLKHLAILLVVIFPLQAIGAVLLLLYLPIHRVLVSRDSSRSVKLPVLLRWFDNADLYVGRDTSVYLSKFGDTLWVHYSWLAFRNPLNYLGYAILGITIEFPYSQKSTTWYAKEADLSTIPTDIGDGTGNAPGLFYTELSSNGKTYFEYYYIKIYKFFGVLKCVRIRIGHKIGRNASKGDHCQWVMVISPFHSFDGNVSENK